MSTQALCSLTQDDSLFNRHHGQRFETRGSLSSTTQGHLSGQQGPLQITYCCYSAATWHEMRNSDDLQVLSSIVDIVSGFSDQQDSLILCSLVDSRRPSDCYFSLISLIPSLIYGRLKNRMSTPSMSSM